jgi:integrase/recombinase XerC
VQRGHGVRCVDDVTPEVVAAYLHATTSDGAEPSVSVQHFRRAAVRVLFRSSRELGLDVGDPSIDAQLPARRPADFRPLDGAEVRVARAAALAGHRDSRASAAWALCEATARTGELSWLRWEHLDHVGARVWILGTRRARCPGGVT